VVYSLDWLFVERKFKHLLKVDVQLAQLLYKGFLTSLRAPLDTPIPHGIGGD
jgi:hypothetical protein